MKWFHVLFFSLAFAFFSLTVVAEPVNINTANASAIAAAMKGVGPKTAKAIVDYRTKHGAFKHVNELVKVKGIGLKTVARNRDAVTVARPK